MTTARATYNVFSTAGLSLVPLRTTDDHVRLAVAGEVDMATASQLDDVLTGLLLERPTLIDIDLEGLRFLDSAGILVLLRNHAAAEEQGCRLMISNPPSSVRRVLHITGVLSLLAAED
ncbi:STAS domain-containing protein [Micromonospora sp. WMMD882]|uniref:STAS domain-containing protein n=1 Tax=Micromonospora sp. WMMD882 TaxID=3015151 RepID=UPI00248C16ED|nr:STAS domain-containing protein [Micromonospora sp. WMMD882]WBB77808.1 STAS domain-containing protein [Micromonospora sp. WMMD882]